LQLIFIIICKNDNNKIKFYYLMVKSLNIILFINKSYKWNNKENSMKIIILFVVVYNILSSKYSKKKNVKIFL